MIDINSETFISDFDMTSACVGIIGHGYVGKAVEAFFDGKCGVMVNDIKEPESQSVQKIVATAEVIFVCVPTPMCEDGSCHVGFVKSVLDDLVRNADEVGRSLREFIVVIKSTVYPGFTEDIQIKHMNLRIVFSPEFLTEKNSIKDFQNTNRVVLGTTNDDDGRVLFKYFEGAIPVRIRAGQTHIVQCPSTVAELAKLYTNGILMTKVLFSNEMYQVCQKLGVDYGEVRLVACLDPRIGSSHTTVPGHDGHLAAGGSCFIKDINNLITLCKEIGVDEKVFSAVMQRNIELRPERDWEELKGRAVIDV